MPKCTCQPILSRERMKSIELWHRASYSPPWICCGDSFECNYERSRSHTQHLPHLTGYLNTILGGAHLGQHSNQPRCVEKNIRAPAEPEDCEALLALAEQTIQSIHSACRTKYSDDAFFCPIFLALQAPARHTKASARFLLRYGLLFMRSRTNATQRLCIPNDDKLLR